jgi:hypothetical protein
MHDQAKIRWLAATGSSGLAEAHRYLFKQKQYDPGRADSQQPRRADYGLP